MFSMRDKKNYHQLLPLIYSSGYIYSKGQLGRVSFLNRENKNYGNSFSRKIS